ncbi:MAG: SRPBCC domain-containing protein [Bryobacteraceae bacterium]|nr:SRPBCC domain-containing protein [Bryobacteraceae bacterium]
MNEKGEVIEIHAVRFVRTLRGPVERVWSYLTECGKLAAWFGEDGRIEPREGGTIWFMGGHIRGVVTAWKPCRRLAYTWNVFDPGESESRYPETYLTFELEPNGSDVNLTLFHLPVPERFSPQTRMGWHTFLDMLQAVVDGSEAESREVCMNRNAALYGVDLKNLAR